MKIGFGSNNQQELICCKTQPTNQPIYIYIYIQKEYIYIYIYIYI